jgi:hypothetical protein
VASCKELLDALVCGGVLLDDGPAHLHLQVVQAFGPERVVRLEVWPAGEMA